MCCDIGCAWSYAAVAPGFFLFARHECADNQPKLGDKIRHDARNRGVVGASEISVFFAERMKLATKVKMATASKQMIHAPFWIGYPGTAFVISRRTQVTRARAHAPIWIYPLMPLFVKSDFMELTLLLFFSTGQYIQRHACAFGT